MKHDCTVKNVAFVSSNRMLLQSLIAAVEARPDLKLRIIPLQTYTQAELGVEACRARIAIVDITGSMQLSAVRKLCGKLHDRMQGGRIFLLVSQNAADVVDMAVQSKRAGIVEDFIFYDSSLSYLFAKLALC